jgi:hypothetical protein
LQAWERYGGPRPVEPSRGPLPPGFSTGPTYGNGYQGTYVPSMPRTSPLPWQQPMPRYYAPPRAYVPSPDPRDNYPPGSNWGSPQLPTTPYAPLPGVPQPWENRSP